MRKEEQTTADHAWLDHMSAQSDPIHARTPLACRLISQVLCCVLGEHSAASHHERSDLVVTEHGILGVEELLSFSLPAASFLVMPSSDCNCQVLSQLHAVVALQQQPGFL